MLQDTLNVLRKQFLGLNRVLSTMMELVNDGLMFDDEKELLNFSAKLLITNHNFQFCTIHTVRDSNLTLACAISTDAILNPNYLKKQTDSQNTWIKTCEHLALQLIELGENNILKRQAGSSVYYAMPIVYRDEILATLTVNSPAIDDNHPKLISIYCRTLTSVLINARNSQFLTQEVARRTEELESALNQADASARVKSQFLANMSHEYLTPLHTISGSSNLLSDSNLETEQSEYVSNILDASIRLQTLVNNMLDYAQSDNGNLAYNPNVVNLPELLQALSDTFLSSAKAKGIELELLMATNLPRFITTDESHLRQILSNLISNAIKFTPAGRVTIDTYCSTIESNNTADTSVNTDATIAFSVIDSGIGISSNEITGIFDALHQVDNSDTRRFQGAGLGLAICQKIAHSLGSEIKVNSTLGEGSSFRFKIKVSIAEQEITAWENKKHQLTLASLDQELKQNGQSQLQQQLNVLLVEDNLINQKLAARLLEKLGCFVDIANDGADAVDMFSRQNYDLIFMDCQMPNMDGFEATSKIREMEKGSRIPIIALTANSLPEDRVRSYKAGMDEFLTKPIIKEKLQNALSKWSLPAS